MVIFNIPDLVTIIIVFSNSHKSTSSIKVDYVLNSRNLMVLNIYVKDKVSAKYMDINLAYGELTCKLPRIHFYNS